MSVYGSASGRSGRAPLTTIGRAMAMAGESIGQGISTGAANYAAGEERKDALVRQKEKEQLALELELAKTGGTSDEETRRRSLREAAPEAQELDEITRALQVDQQQLFDEASTRDRHAKNDYGDRIGPPTKEEQDYLTGTSKYKTLVGQSMNNTKLIGEDARMVAQAADGEQADPYSIPEQIGQNTRRNSRDERAAKAATEAEKRQFELDKEERAAAQRALDRVEQHRLRLKEIGLANSTKAADRAADDEKEARKEARPAEAVVNTVSDFDASIATASRLMELKDKVDTGPLVSRIPDLVASNERIELEALTKELFNQYRKAITGAGASIAEIEDLQKSMPSMNDNDDPYKTKLQAFINKAERSKNIHLLNQTRNGKDMSAFMAPDDAQMMAFAIQNPNDENAKAFIADWTR